jgi:hypothetical protein
MYWKNAGEYMKQTLSLPTLFEIFKWSHGTQAQAEEELLRRAKMFDEMLEMLVKVEDAYSNGESVPFHLDELIAKAKGEQ